MEGTTKVCKKVTGTLSCLTLLAPPLVLFYGLVRGSLKPADEKGEKNNMNNMAGSWKDHDNELLTKYSAPRELVLVGRAPRSIYGH